MNVQNILGFVSQTLFLFFSFLLFSGVAVSAQLSDLYTVSVEVSTQLPDDQDEAFDEALKKVLIKVSGDYYRIVDTPILQSFGAGKPYVQAFIYRDNPAYLQFKEDQLINEQALTEVAGGEQEEVGLSSADDESSNEDTQENGEPGNGNEVSAEVEPKPYLLDVTFASQQINEKMISYGVPIWGATRPSVLLGAVLEENGDRVMLTHSDMSSVDFDGAEMISSLSKSHGLPLYLPLGDLEDMANIDVGDVWGLFPEALSASASRYQSDVVIMMKLYPSVSGGWSANWRIQHKDIYAIGELYDTTQEDIFQNLIADTSYILASRYAVLKSNGEEPQGLNLEVSGINSFKDYVLMQRHLEQLPPVASAHLKWLSKTKVGYEVKLNGSTSQFFEHAELGGKLFAKPDASKPELINDGEDHLVSTKGDLQSLSPAWLNATERARLTDALEEGEDIHQTFSQLLSKGIHYLVWKGER